MRRCSLSCGLRRIVEPRKNFVCCVWCLMICDCCVFIVWESIASIMGFFSCPKPNKVFHSHHSAQWVVVLLGFLSGCQLILLQDWLPMYRSQNWKHCFLFVCLFVFMNENFFGLFTRFLIRFEWKMNCNFICTLLYLCYLVLALLCLPSMLHFMWVWLLPMWAYVFLFSW